MNLLQRLWPRADLSLSFLLRFLPLLLPDVPLPEGVVPSVAAVSSVSSESGVSPEPAASSEPSVSPASGVWLESAVSAESVLLPSAAVAASGASPAPVAWGAGALAGEAVPSSTVSSAWLVPVSVPRVSSVPVPVDVCVPVVVPVVSLLLAGAP